MNGFSVKLDLRIDWSEIDLFGHVNNLAILKYVQAARVNYLELIDLMQLQSEKNWANSCLNQLPIQKTIVLSGKYKCLFER